jgi:hypothetical protein
MKPVLAEEDFQAWNLYRDTEHRWVFNKLEVALRQGLHAGPAATAPDRNGTYIYRPIYNLYGMGIGAKKFKYDKDSMYDSLIKLSIEEFNKYKSIIENVLKKNFETNFKKEVFSDLTGERGTLMGAIQGIFAAQYQVLRERGHSPSEAFNETVEELTQSLMPLVAENGMDWMYANCSTTAQRGALDWWKKFKDATLPVFNELYDSVAAGNESQRSIDSNSQPDYREKLEVELKELRESEMWQAGKTVRSLRPENQSK